MAKKFPKFSQALAEDPTTRRLWFGIATAHDFESHDGMTESTLYQKIFAFQNKIDRVSFRSAELIKKLKFCDPSGFFIFGIYIE